MKHSVSALAVAMTVVVAGCSLPGSDEAATSMQRDSAPSAPDPSPGGYGFVWHEPAPGVEIGGAEYTFVRAATESFYRALSAGEVDGGFPGFSEAIDQSQDIGDFIDRIGNPGDDPKRAGAYDVRVVARTTDSSTERVSVCLYSDRILVQSVDDPEQFRVGRPEAMAVDAGELVFDKTGMAPEPEVSGPQSIPEGGNFFGDWKLRSYAFNSYGQGAEASVHNDRRCQASRGDIPEIPGAGKTVPAGSQPPIPPVPGWPGDIS